MNNTEQIPRTNSGDSEPPGHDPFSSPHRRLTSFSEDPRLAALEIENARLQRLVAELLIKNQQLRKPD